MTFGKLFFADRGPLLRFGPSVLVHIVWWTWALLEPVTRFGRFTEVTPYKGQYYYMSITMVFGSLVAGSTSEGGGAIAYPVSGYKGITSFALAGIRNIEAHSLPYRSCPCYLVYLPLWQGIFPFVFSLLG